jgi:hypothetical protein
MVFAMADSGLIGARVVPAVGWSALLASMAMAMAFAGRLRRQGHGSQGTGRGGLAGLEVTLGLLAMAAIQFAGATTSEAHTLTTSGHAHAPIGMALVAIGIALLLVLAGLAFRHRSVTERPSRHQTAARACMLCSLTAMTMAIVV